MLSRVPPAAHRSATNAIRRAGFALSVLLLLVGAFWQTPAVHARDLAVELQMHYIHQYLGNLSDDHDCGPTSVAMVLDAYGLRPAGLSDARFVASIRRTMGVPADTGTVYTDLARAFDAYGLRYSYIYSNMPGEPVAEARLMQSAIGGGNLVIPMVHGAVLGRGAAYGDHWPVLVGFSGDTVHLLDPDDQTPRSSDWVRGGDITISLATLEQATLKAQPGAYAMIIYAPAPLASSGLTVGVAAHIGGTGGDGAFLRSSPGIGDNKLTSLPEGTEVTVAGPFPLPNADGRDWIGVSVNGQQGYVAAEYVVADGS
ncbi:MAG: SH3 domain-containing protein [Dehalococcoidia bacterium]